MRRSFLFLWPRWEGWLQQTVQPQLHHLHPFAFHKGMDPIHDGYRVHQWSLQLAHRLFLGKLRKWAKLISFYHFHEGTVASVTQGQNYMTERTWQLPLFQIITPPSPKIMTKVTSTGCKSINKLISLPSLGSLHAFKCSLGSPGGSDGKRICLQCRRRGLGRSPGEGNGNSLQYSCLENSMDRGAWRATIHGVAKTWTRLNNSWCVMCLFLNFIILLPTMSISLDTLIHY